MKSGVVLVFLLLQLCFLGSWSTEATIGRHQHDSNAIPNPVQVAEKEHKLLIECQNSDYRTYIKCLKREKRHHPLGNTRCLDECFERNCTTSACIRDCHSHCKKRLIETYSQTVETSYDCEDSVCNEKSNNTPNITNVIHINNIIPNVTSSHYGNNGANGANGGNGGNGGNAGNAGSDGSAGSSANKTTVKDQLPRIDINNIINNQFPPGGYYPGSDCSCRMY